MKMSKTYAVEISDNTERKESKSKWIGHIVECTDLDSADIFAVEVMLNAKIVDEEAVIAAASRAAEKDHLVQLSGNTFSFEYLGKSGRVVELEQYTFSTETYKRTEESEQMLANYQPG
jgi:hypothetical protein